SSKRFAPMRGCLPNAMPSHCCCSERGSAWRVRPRASPAHFAMPAWRWRRWTPAPRAVLIMCCSPRAARWPRPWSRSHDGRGNVKQRLDSARASLAVGLLIAAAALVVCVAGAGGDVVGILSFLLRFLHVLAAAVWIGLIVFVNSLLLAVLKG